MKTIQLLLLENIDCGNGWQPNKQYKIIDDSKNNFLIWKGIKKKEAFVITNDLTNDRQKSTIVNDR